MKTFLSILILVLLAGLLGWFISGKSDESETTVPQSSEAVAEQPQQENEPLRKNTINDSLASIEENLNEASVKESPQLSPEQRAELLAQAKSDLDNLIIEYNDNIGDPALKAQTQNKIETLLKQYNELVLPIALAKLNEE